MRILAQTIISANKMPTPFTASLAEIAHHQLQQCNLERVIRVNAADEHKSDGFVLRYKVSVNLGSAFDMQQNPQASAQPATE